MINWPRWNAEQQTTAISMTRDSALLGNIVSQLPLKAQEEILEILVDTYADKKDTSKEQLLTTEILPGRIIETVQRPPLVFEDN